MIEHHIQKNIVYRLAFSDGLRFSELKPDGIENKLFDYHLKLVMKAGLVEKADSGVYQLTPDGKRMGVSVFLSDQERTNQARSVLFLIIRRQSDGAYLLYRRSTHPIKGKIGFMHATPSSDRTIVEQAKYETKERTNLDCEFSQMGSGFIKTLKDEELESFVNFTLLVCEDARGELVSTDERAEYFWDNNPNFESEDMIPNMKLLFDSYSKNKLFFIDSTVQI